MLYLKSIKQISFFITLSILTGVATPITARDSFHSAATDITIIIDFGNGSIRQYTEVYGSDVLNVTESILEVEMYWIGDLAYMTAIDGVANNPNDGLFWQYWVNGELGPVAVNKYQLNDGDILEWKRQASAFGEPNPQYEDPSLVVGIIGVSLFGFIFLIIIIIRGLKR